MRRTHLPVPASLLRTVFNCICGKETLQKDSHQVQLIQNRKDYAEIYIARVFLSDHGNDIDKIEIWESGEKGMVVLLPDLDS